MIYELLRELFPWVVGFYLLDGVLRVPPGELLFLTTWGGARHEVRGPGLHYAGISPLTEGLAASHAVVLTECLAPPPHGPGHAKRFSPSLRSGSESRRAVRVRDEALMAPDLLPEDVRPSTPEALEEARRRDAPERVAALRATAAAIRAPRRRLRWLAAAFFVALVLVLPLLLYGDAPPSTTLPLAAGLGALHVAIVATSAQILRLAKAPSPASIIVPLLVFPPNAARAPLAVSRAIPWDAGPFALALAVMEERELRLFAGREIQRLHRWAAQAPDLAASLEALAGERRALVAARGMLLEDAAPPAADPDARAYCPLCGAQFRHDAGGHCPDCFAELRPHARDPAPRPR